MASKTITVKLIKSFHGTVPGMRATIKGLGLNKIGATRTLENTPCVRGMIKKVIHLLEIKE